MGGKFNDAANIATLGVYKGIGADEWLTPGQEKPKFGAANQIGKPGRPLDPGGEVEKKKPRLNVSSSARRATSASALLTTDDTPMEEV